MFDAAWHDEQIALPQLHGAVAEFDLELALEHEKEIVGVRIAVPDELALDLDDLDLVAVHRCHDAWREALVEQRELLREIDRLVHGTADASTRLSGVAGRVRTPLERGVATFISLFSSAGWLLSMCAPGS